MARNLIVNGVTYNGVEALEMTDVNGEKVRYSEGGGGGTQPSASTKAVNFRDYDGTPLYSYTAEEALALSELPPLPVRDGLICQEWNWSLADMQEYVASYGVCEIVATYITDDGKTRLHITIAAEGRMNVPLYISQTIAHGVTIDWGDGSAAETLPATGNVNTMHTYAGIGDYVITLDAADECVLGLGRKSSGYCILGRYVDEQKVYHNMLRNVFVGNGVTNIDIYAFHGCQSLASITIPKGVTNIGNNAFYRCLALANIIIPNGVANIVNNAFDYCQSLASITIPNGVANIGDNAFYGCQSLASITIPSSVTSIGGTAFADCSGMAFYDFTKHASVPTLANSNAFTGIPADCEIRVPAALLDEWKAETNWSAVSDNIVGV